MVENSPENWWGGVGGMKQEYYFSGSFSILEIFDSYSSIFHFTITFPLSFYTVGSVKDCANVVLFF